MTSTPGLDKTDGKSQSFISCNHSHSCSEGIDLSKLTIWFCPKCRAQIPKIRLFINKGTINCQISCACENYSPINLEYIKYKTIIESPSISLGQCGNKEHEKYIATNYCIDCQKWFCNKCNEIDKEGDLIHKNHYINRSPFIINNDCPEHRGSKLYHCIDCSKIQCVKERKILNCNYSSSLFNKEIIDVIQKINNDDTLQSNNTDNGKDFSELLEKLPKYSPWREFIKVYLEMIKQTRACQFFDKNLIENAYYNYLVLKELKEKIKDGINFPLGYISNYELFQLMQDGKETPTEDFEDEKETGNYTPFIRNIIPQINGNLISIICTRLIVINLSYDNGSKGRKDEISYFKQDEKNKYSSSQSTNIIRGHEGSESQSIQELRFDKNDATENYYTAIAVLPNNNIIAASTLKNEYKLVLFKAQSLDKNNLPKKGKTYLIRAPFKIFDKESLQITSIVPLDDTNPKVEKNKKYFFYTSCSNGKIFKWMTDNKDIQYQDTLKGRFGSVTTMILKNQETLIIASLNKGIIFWDLNNDKALNIKFSELSGASPCFLLYINKNDLTKNKESNVFQGDELIIGFYDGTIELWEEVFENFEKNNYKLRARLRKHISRIISIIYLPNKGLITAETDGYIFLWDIVSLEITSSYHRANKITAMSLIPQDYTKYETGTFLLVGEEQKEQKDKFKYFSIGIVSK